MDPARKACLDWLGMYCNLPANSCVSPPLQAEVQPFCLLRVRTVIVNILPRTSADFLSSLIVEIFSEPVMVLVLFFCELFSDPSASSENWRWLKWNYKIKSVYVASLYYWYSFIDTATNYNELIKSLLANVRLATMPALDNCNQIQDYWRLIGCIYRFDRCDLLQCVEMNAGVFLSSSEIAWFDRISPHIVVKMVSNTVA